MAGQPDSECGVVSRKSDAVQCGVVGGDPSALVFALLLARSGWTVRVLARGAGRSAHTGVSPFLSPSSLAVMADLGLLDHLLAVGGPVREMVEHSPGAGHRVLDYGAGGRERFPYALSVPLSTLTEVLREALAGEGSAEVRSGTSVRGIEDAGSAVVLDLVDAGGPTSLECGFVVCAGGKFSKTRDLLGIGADVVEFDRPLVMVVVPTPTGWPERIEAHHDERNSLVTTIPLAGGRMIVQWLAAPEEFEQVRAAGVGELRSRIARVLPDLAEPLVAALSGWDEVLVVRHHVVRPRTWSVGRVGLLADAAHGVHSFAGQGVNLGIQDAVVLAASLVEAGVDAGTAPLVEYERVRRPFVESFQRYQLETPQLTSQPRGERGGRTLYGGIEALMVLGQPEATVRGKWLINRWSERANRQ